MGKKEERQTTLLINDVAMRVGLSQKRIREYEKGGLIRPEREPRTNNRRFTESDIKQILRIKQLIHEYGFTIACLRYFLASAPCWVIFNCVERKSCLNTKDPRTACYEMVQRSANEQGRAKCRRCPIYLNRHAQKVPLLEKP